LLLRILDTLAFNGPMSRRELADRMGANYPDVWVAVKSLKQRKFINRSAIFTEKGKPRIVYGLSKLGFQAFLTEDHTPKEFWSALIILYKQQEHILEHEIEGNVTIFIDKYIGQNICRAYSFYSNLYFFDIIFKSYWENNKKSSMLEEDAVPLSQKILEYLSFNRLASLKEIATATNVPQEQIITFLEEFCPDFYRAQAAPINMGPHASLERYRDVLSHSLVVSSLPARKKESRYELSLFGIMLILAVIRAENIFEFFNISKKRTNFYNISLDGFLEKLAKNYSEKLPLIFGKWNKIKLSFVNSDCILPLLFDPVFFKDERPGYFSLPLPKGGNKEIHESIKAISSIATSKLSEIYEEGCIAFTSLDEKYRNQTLFAPIVLNILDKLEIHLGYADVDLTLKNLTKMKKTSRERIPPDYLKIIESLFEKEITFIFYASLLREESYNRQWTNERELFLPSTTDHRFVSGKNLLLEITKQDHDINYIVRKWVKDSCTYQTEVSRRMQSLVEELEVGKNSR
jgi:DNA-binding Lrp family transcriptional regulator